MIQRFVGQIPFWSQQVHPVLRHMLERGQPRTQPRLWRYMRLILPLLAVIAMLLLSYELATDFGAQPSAPLHDILYMPLVIFGVIVGLTAITLPGNVISAEKSRGTWDTLRVTLLGATLTLQARWIAVFYHLRWPLAALLAARVLLVAGILVDLAQYFRGHYLDLLLSGITPGVPVLAGAVLLAAIMAAALLQPLVAVGLDAAVGLLVGVLVRQPRYVMLVQGALGVFRLLLAGLAILVGFQMLGLPEWGGVSQLAGVPEWASPPGAWAGTLFLSVFGDQGLRLLNLEASRVLWADLDYSIFIGVVLLVLTLFQAWLANRLVGIASRLAERVE